MNDIDFLEESVHRLSDAIGRLRGAPSGTEKQSAALEVIDAADELSKSFVHVLPEIERRAVMDAQVE